MSNLDFRCLDSSHHITLSTIEDDELDKVTPDRRGLQGQNLAFFLILWVKVQLALWLKWYDTAGAIDFCEIEHTTPRRPSVNWLINQEVNGRRLFDMQKVSSGKGAGNIYQNTSF